MKQFRGIIGSEVVTEVFAEDEFKALSMVRRNLFSTDDSFETYAKWAEHGSRVEEIKRRTPDV